MKVRQRAVALYFIDKLALRAGNEKDEDQADTVGCCSLRIEHIKLHQKHEGEKISLFSFMKGCWRFKFNVGKDNVVELDFLGKDSIRYHNFFQVEFSGFVILLIFIYQA